MYYLFAFCLFVFCRIALFSLIITQNPTTLYSAKNLSPRGTPRRLCIVRQSFPTFRTWIPTKTSFPDPLSFPSPGESRRDRCGKGWQQGRSPDYSPVMLLWNYVQGAAHFLGFTLFSFLLQTSMNVMMESMIAFVVWLPVKTHWVRLIALVTMDT